MSRKKYEPWEDDLISAHYQTEGPHFLTCLLLHRTIGSIMQRAGTLGVRSKAHPEWTLAEINRLRRCCPDIDLAVRTLPGRSVLAIQTKWKVLGLSRTRKAWRPSEKELIRKLHLTHTDQQLADILGRTARSVGHERIVQRLLRTGSPKVLPSGLLLDLRREAQRRGVHLKTLTNALGRRSLKPGEGGAAHSKSLAQIVNIFGGEIYAEWED